MCSVSTVLLVAPYLKALAPDGGRRGFAETRNPHCSAAHVDRVGGRRDLGGCVKDDRVFIGRTVADARPRTTLVVAARRDAGHKTNISTDDRSGELIHSHR